MSDEKGMTQADWTAEMLKDADYIGLPKHYLLRRKGKWRAYADVDGKCLTRRGFKHPADAYQKLMEIIADS